MYGSLDAIILQVQLMMYRASMFRVTTLCDGLKIALIEMMHLRSK